jgi:outer membrane protein insertion porin family
MPKPRSVPLAIVLLVAAGRAEARLVIRSIVLRGAEKTTPEAVEARTQMRAGDPITIDSMDRARELLLATGLFTRVDVTIDLPRREAVRLMYFDQRERAVDLQVSVEEKQSWFVFPIFSAGGGDVSGGLVYVDRNLDGRAVELGGAGQLGASKNSIQVGFRDPMMTVAPFTYALGAYFRQDDFRFFSSHRKVQEVPTRLVDAEGRFGYVFSSNTRALFGARYQRLQVDDPTLLADTGQGPLGPVSCPDGTLRDAGGVAVARAEPYNCLSGNVVTLLFDLSYDSTLAPRGLRTGALVSFRDEIADAIWGSDFDYVRLEFKLGLYGHLWRTYPSALLRSVFAFPTSTDGMPLTETLRAGGSNPRGYFVDEFHGDTLVSLQVEEQVWLIELTRLWRLNLAAAAFADTAALAERHPAGRVATAPTPGAGPRVNLGDFHSSVGGGLRFLLPGVAIPAIRFDVGYGLDVQDYAVTFTVASD